MRNALPGLGLSALLAGSAIAADAVKPDDAIHYRQSVYTMIAWNFGPLGQMVKGKRTWDGKAFALHAERVAALTPQLLEGFPAGSDKGAKTGAKPVIWTEMDDFRAKMDELVKQSAQLAAVAKAGDEAQMKDQFGKTAQACKSCHEKFRSRD